MYRLNTTYLGMESPDVGTPELNHANVQQCSIVHGELMKKHGGMIHGIDAIPSVSEVLPTIVVVAIDNDVCLQ
jgi:hypothetical protein